MYISQVQLT